MPSGAPGCEMEAPKQESPLYKNAPNRDSGFLSRRWSRLERGGSERRSAGSDRSGKPYLTALLQENKEGESINVNLMCNKIRITLSETFNNVEYTATGDKHR